MHLRSIYTKVIFSFVSIKTYSCFIKIAKRMSRKCSMLFEKIACIKFIFFFVHKEDTSVMFYFISIYSLPYVRESYPLIIQLSSDSGVKHFLHTQGHMISFMLMAFSVYIRTSKFLSSLFIYIANLLSMFFIQIKSLIARWYCSSFIEGPIVGRAQLLIK